MVDALKAVESNGDTSGLLKTQINTLYEDLRNHPAFEYANTGHRFKGNLKKAWCFKNDRIMG